MKENCVAGDIFLGDFFGSSKGKFLVELADIWFPIVHDHRSFFLLPRSALGKLVEEKSVTVLDWNSMILKITGHSEPEVGIKLVGAKMGLIDQILLKWPEPLPIGDGPTELSV